MSQIEPKTNNESTQQYLQTTKVYQILSPPWHESSLQIQVLYTSLTWRDFSQERLQSVALSHKLTKSL